MRVSRWVASPPPGRAAPDWEESWPNAVRHTHTRTHTYTRTLHAHAKGRPVAHCVGGFSLSRLSSHWDEEEKKAEEGRGFSSWPNVAFAAPGQEREHPIPSHPTTPHSDERGYIHTPAGVIMNVFLPPLKGTRHSWASADIGGEEREGCLTSHAASWRCSLLMSITPPPPPSPCVSSSSSVRPFVDRPFPVVLIHIECTAVDGTHQPQPRGWDLCSCTPVPQTISFPFP